MHEWSLALEIIKIGEKEATLRKARSVAEVEIRLGKLNNIVKDQLVEAFEIAKNDTLLSSAVLHVVEVSAKARCGKCEKDFEIELPLIYCPNCGNMDISVESGEEMHFSKVVLDFD